MNIRIFFPILICATAMTMAAQEYIRAQPGDMVLQMDFESADARARWSSQSCASWVELPGRGTCLKVVVPNTELANSGNMTELPIDVSAYGNCQLLFTCQAKAENVSKPSKSYLGVKYMFNCNSKSDGQQWVNENDVHGTFDWKQLRFKVSIPGDVEQAKIVLGMQESHGTIYFDDIVITVLRSVPSRPKPNPNAPPVFKGHSLPRLRGVMSPNEFKDEDLRVLGEEWNANLIRWQMTTRWAAEYKSPQDYNMELYDQWLDKELEDLDQVLNACRKYGIMVVIDLHSPPGGRRPNKDLVMLHEPAYLDKFVSVWELIARRYKDNPSVWAYDLVNEPVMSMPAPEGMPDYLGAQTLAAKAIRAIDPKTPIIIEVDYWDSAEGFKYIDHPVDIPRIIYQVHMYWPGAFTHQGVNDAKIGVDYPGKINNELVDKETLRKHLEPVREFQLAYNVHIYAGEFSAIRWAPNDSAYRYLRDCIDLFEEYGWDWTYHAYREWDGWSVEHGNDPNEHLPAETQTGRKKLLLGWCGKNERP